MEFAPSKPLKRLAGEMQNQWLYGAAPLSGLRSLRIAPAKIERNLLLIFCRVDVINALCPDNKLSGLTVVFWTESVFGELAVQGALGKPEQGGGPGYMAA